MPEKRGRPEEDQGFIRKKKSRTAKRRGGPETKGNVGPNERQRDPKRRQKGEKVRGAEAKSTGGQKISQRARPPPLRRRRNFKNRLFLLAPAHLVFCRFAPTSSMAQRRPHSLHLLPPREMALRGGFFCLLSVPLPHEPRRPLFGLAVLYPSSWSSRRSLAAPHLLSSSMPNAFKCSLS